MTAVCDDDDEQTTNKKAHSPLLPLWKYNQKNERTNERTSERAMRVLSSQPYTSPPLTRSFAVGCCVFYLFRVFILLLLLTILLPLFSPFPHFSLFPRNKRSSLLAFAHFLCVSCMVAATHMKCLNAFVAVVVWYCRIFDIYVDLIEVRHSRVRASPFSVRFGEANECANRFFIYRNYHEYNLDYLLFSSLLLLILVYQFLNM